MRSLFFLALAFALSWGVAIVGYPGGLADTQLSGVVMLAFMAGPGAAAIVCAMVFEKGHRAEALGLRSRPNFWWLAAWIIALAIVAGSVLFSRWPGGVEIVDFEERLSIWPAAGADGRDGAPTGSQHVSVLNLLAIAATLGVLVNTLMVTLTEEFGWRGYLHFLWRGAGFWQASLGTGFAWGAWHAPAIYLYGENYPDARLPGVALFLLWCILLSPIVTLVRERGGSVWAAGIFHATINSTGPIGLLMLREPPPLWSGIVGIGGVLSILLALLALSPLLRFPRATSSSDR